MGQWPEWRRERLWELWGQGHSIHAIARELGVFRTSVTRYLNLTGGVRPRPRRRSKRSLSVSEREEISRGLARGESFRAIACQIGRPHTTVSREVGRNGGRRRYRAQRAEAAAWRRARRPKPSKLALEAPLRAVVCKKLCRKWSPEQIAAWLRRTHSDDPAMRVSHETIYLSLFVQSRGALRRELCDHLRSGRRLRRPPAQRSKHQGQGQIPDKVMICERPAEASDRAVPGHWEGDLLLGQRPTGVATLVERQTRYLQLVALPDGHAAAAVRDALARSIGQLPKQLRRSLTWDQGKEMLEHARFTVDSGVQIYFCDPRSPWQRGSNENTNGLLRQYLPKRTDLSRFTQRQLDAIAQELNDRPRQTLGWATPAERLAEVLAQTPQR
ncbi:MAG: IS30 family transposase [Actinomycetota bacterium]|nr:IS30 family transposase [Actinomycetota bacterium]